MTTKDKLYQVIFEADTRPGKYFDVALLVLIVLSVLLVVLESVSHIREKFGDIFHISEWVITVLFTVEYILRIFIVKKPFKYIFSFYGIIDFLSTIPTYVGLLFTGTPFLLAIRGLRLLRVFRILKLTRYLREAEMIYESFKASRIKISVFLFTVVTLVIIIGSVMYLVEGENNGFVNIPRSVYWTVVTLTTVGYGDISPQTTLGQFLAGFAMILGYAIIAVPTGIVTFEMIKTKSSNDNNTTTCQKCLKPGHEQDAKYCKYCGEKLLKEDD
jgi:voltage-gated potassium channel